MGDLQVDHFGLVDMSKFALPMIVVYYNTTDYPNQYVARLWDLNRPTNVMHVNETLDKVRKSVPDHFIRLHRDEKDDPVIVEIWV